MMSTDMRDQQNKVMVLVPCCTFRVGVAIIALLEFIQFIGAVNYGPAIAYTTTAGTVGGGFPWTDTTYRHRVKDWEGSENPVFIVLGFTLAILCGITCLLVGMSALYQRHEYLKVTRIIHLIQTIAVCITSVFLINAGIYMCGDTHGFGVPLERKSGISGYVSIVIGAVTIPFQMYFHYMIEKFCDYVYYKGELIV